MAFGLLHLTPDQFWDLLPDEFFLAVEGYDMGREWQRELAAWMVMHITAPHVQEPWTMDDLLGRASEDEDDSEEAKLERIWAKVQQQRAGKQQTEAEPGS